MKIAKVVASAMSSTTFYKRKKLEVLAREALGTAKINSGERAAMKAVSYVQKYMGNVVKTHAEPGKNAGDRYLYIAGWKNKETGISDTYARDAITQVEVLGGLREVSQAINKNLLDIDYLTLAASN